MSDRVPFFLNEAIVSLFLAAADGSPVGTPLWAGAYANGVRFSHALDEVILTGSGDRYGTAHHIDEANVITIDRTWLLRRTDLVDFFPARNQTYALQFIWTSGGSVFQRTFYGVTGRTLEQNSQGTNQTLTSQVFRAQWFADARGTLAVPIAAPVVPTTTPEALGFFHEDPLAPGSYLLGFYRFTTPATLASASVIAWAPQTSAVVLTLEVNGSLTAATLTIPVGAANTEVTAAVSLGGLAVPAGQLVRWVVTSAPAIEDSAWKVAVLLTAAVQV